MLKHKINSFESAEPQVGETESAEPQVGKAADLRLANDNDAPAQSAARNLQQDIARAFAQEARWSVRRTVAIGVAFHVGVFCALALAAGGALTQLQH